MSFPAWGAAFTERGDGDLRVSARSPGEPLAAVQGRVLGLLGLGGVAVPRQLHGSEVVAVAERVVGYAVGVSEGDGVATAVAGVGVGVHVADCLPIAIGGVGGVAMLHAGWRGLLGGVVAEGVRALRGLGVASTLQAVIGPGAGGCCYETGDDVRELFAPYGASHGALLDLKAVASAQLVAAGVSTVRDVALCTICDRRFFSHRREGAASGRQGGFAWLS